MTRAHGVLLAVFFASAAFGHGMQTAYLEILEGKTGTSSVTWRLSVADNLIRPHFPEGCRLEDGPHGPERVGASSFLLRCDRPLEGKKLSVSGMGTLVTETMVRVRKADGETASTVLTADNPGWEIPAKASAAGVFGKYVRLGVFHILSGADHLLFLLGLLFLVRGRKRLLVTCTAFTLAHSITLALTSLGLLSLSPAAAEAVIALSLVYVALAIADGRDSFGQGLVNTFLFGLVHGLGFAGALREVGLPKDALPASLLGFNVGVELGQITFLLAGLALAFLAQRFRFQKASAVTATYVVGGLGAYWFIERLVVVLG